VEKEREEWDGVLRERVEKEREEWEGDKAEKQREGWGNEREERRLGLGFEDKIVHVAFMHCNMCNGLKRNMHIWLLWIGTHVNLQ
jgi:hypothetical protein